MASTSILPHDDDWPAVPDALLAKLEAAFPPVLVNPKTAWEEAMYRAGQRNVVETIQKWKEWGEKAD